MTEPIVSLDTIRQQAAKAAQIYGNVNDACPYPFSTQAGREFKAAFELARNATAPQQKKETT